MIFQLVNIIAGILLSSVYIKKYIHEKTFIGVLGMLEEHSTRIGVAVFALGLVALLQRIGIIFVGFVGSSFPQALPLIATGLLLGAPILSQHFTFLKDTIDKLENYKVAVGVVAILSGLGSLLFGCVLPLVCHAPF